MTRRFKIITVIYFSFFLVILGIIVYPHHDVNDAMQMRPLEEFIPSSEWVVIQKPSIVGPYRQVGMANQVCEGAFNGARWHKNGKTLDFQADSSLSIEQLGIPLEAENGQLCLLVLGRCPNNPTPHP